MIHPINANSQPNTVVLIHGLWMTPRSWELWQTRFETRGMKVLAPSWPGLEGEVEALNRDPAPLAALSISQVIDAYDQLIRSLNQPPIIMGHSLGGTVLQVLLDRGLGAAGVGIAPGTVKGVPDLPFTTLRSTFPVLHNPRNRSRAVPLSRKQFHYAFTNTLTRQESDQIFDRYHVPCASRVLFEAGFASFDRHSPTTVDFNRPNRAPLLFVSFQKDHIVPPSASRHNAEKYAKSVSVTEFREFPERPHFPGVPGWEEVADYSLDWALKHSATQRPVVA